MTLPPTSNTYTRSDVAKVAALAAYDVAIAVQVAAFTIVASTIVCSVFALAVLRAPADAIYPPAVGAICAAVVVAKRATAARRTAFGTLPEQEVEP